MGADPLKLLIRLLKEHVDPSVVDGQWRLPLMLSQCTKKAFVHLRN